MHHTDASGSSRFQAQSLVLAEHIRPLFEELPAALDNTREGSNELSTAEILSRFARKGLLDLDLLRPTSSSVSARDLRRVATILACLAERSGTLASIYMVNAILAPAVVAIEGTAEQKQRLLPKIQAGILQLAFALTEPEAGSDAGSLTTTATPAKGGFVLQGEKLYTTGAETANWIIVVARAADMSSKRAFGLFLVPRNAPGLSIRPLAKLSANPHASCHLIFEDVHVADDDVLGGRDRLGAVWSTLRLTGMYERLVVAALACGLGRAIVLRALEFAKSRRQFGQAIASYQAIQHTLVEMRTLETAMYLFVENALFALETSGDATQEVCMAKYYCAEQLQTIASLGMRVMGGRSYFEFEDMSRYYREAPFCLYAGGTIEIQKMLIARTMDLG
jgi:alkylation response protein AidB-like acyl-CoA dehydrogenase